MTKQMSEHAQVAKLLKQKAKQLGLEARVSSKIYSGGCNATIWINSGSDKAVQELKDYSEQFEYGKFDGMTDCYHITNNREDIPQVKYLFVNDERAFKILEALPGKLWDYEFYVNKVKCGSPANFIYQIKQAFPNDKWQSALKTFVNEDCKFPFGGNGYLFEIKKPNKEAA